MAPGRFVQRRGSIGNYAGNGTCSHPDAIVRAPRSVSAPISPPHCAYDNPTACVCRLAEEGSSRNNPGRQPTKVIKLRRFGARGSWLTLEPCNCGDD
jgi:hypothetical protein